MEYIVIERKMFIAYVIQPMGTYRTGADDDVIHDRQCHQSGSHDIAAVRRVKKRDVSFEKRGAQPNKEKRERGKRIILYPRPKHERRKHPVLHEQYKS